jgi:ABC-type transport system involved in multi-copper enzyme maturation permease subunit
MNASVTTTRSTSTRAGIAAPSPRPSYVGIVRGELFKIARLRIAWIMAGLLVCIIGGTALLILARPDNLKADPVRFLSVMTEVDLSVLRIFGGIALVVLTAHVIGLEYQQGTIRILLGRGVGRLQLLSAKVLALAGVALAGLVVGLLLEAALGTLVVLVVMGSPHALTTLSATYWTNTWFYLLATLISTGATLLLGVAVTVVGRSLAFGLGVGLSWFAADNIGTLIMLLLNGFTHSAFWLNITGFFLGPILNDLPALLVPVQVVVRQGPNGPVHVAQTADAIGATPLVAIGSAQALWVILGYCAVFAAVAVVLTWRRDVLE